ncbi:MAG: UvrB/UvrC motif-containing protein, partial [Butyricicoccus sp.]|nr:UvrB/UvrC motif-containing protein [Butyricicoccus sp.]
DDGIMPRTIRKSVPEILEISGAPAKTPAKRGAGKAPKKEAERQAEIERLTRQMKEAAKLLEFELAAELRDQIRALGG